MKWSTRCSHLLVALIRAIYLKLGSRLSKLKAGRVEKALGKDKPGHACALDLRRPIQQSAIWQVQSLLDCYRMSSLLIPQNIFPSAVHVYIFHFPSVILISPSTRMDFKCPALHCILHVPRSDLQTNIISSRRITWLKDRHILKPLPELCQSVFQKTWTTNPHYSWIPHL